MVGYQGDLPHKIKCIVCGREFWTGLHISEGKCRICKPNYSDEMDAKEAYRILGPLLSIKFKYNEPIRDK